MSEQKRKKQRMLRKAMIIEIITLVLFYLVGVRSIGVSGTTRMIAFSILLFAILFIQKRIRKAFFCYVRMR